MKNRLDVLMVQKKLVSTRSQAESWIRLGKVLVDGKVVEKAGYFVREDAVVELKAEEQYVSRAGLKLASVAKVLGVDFKDKVVLDVGSSTGGFTDYALRRGAKKVYAVDVGTDQLHPKLRRDARVDLHEKTNILDVGISNLEFRKRGLQSSFMISDSTIDIILVDVSFVSLRELLPHISYLMSRGSVLLAMVKPQFEAGRGQANKGVIKNDTVRRDILRDFEVWAKQYFVVVGKADSEIAGARGNRERFYKLHML